MNIEIANKLLQLRKEKGLSQEALAQELGISRQAVSKWERAEASPDTDNLIELAKLYDISLDELLLHEPTTKEEKPESQEDEQPEKYVHIGMDGIHVKENTGDEVHVSWKGIHVHEKGGDKVDIDEDGVYINGKKREKKDWDDFKYEHRYEFPFGTIVFLGYLIYVVMTGQWHPTWIILFIIPLFSSLASAIRKRKLSHFAYPVLALMIFLWYGFTQYLWHPAWIIFLTVPCYYAIAHYIDHRKNFS
ncbi:MAG: helix-turn-helix transcriptional regulator [Longibaculum muris]|uniref:Transcriptional regulator with XRE-family HTH domain n=1 Tax=Longibaculum muris TaxID=1796628 RepID=A0A4R3ZA99_9FIRM|nr:helix-turn-helix transcriptional regulator [Longibaculum muris]KXU45521.1 DNA-binding helix-turn-helix protein [Candidatus Stoquefichus sp. KLE1796]MCR1886573.1 helix-turn-helix transcriptional regulator [Longibaculum muris]MED9813048.1 helix-turn-helix transcriptional regulator [Longibaculum muris]TCW01626.1 transcriptional regulator with XRE-family HTH domain [Longibaculum muris]